MKVGIMQPYFLPYIGYFQLMKYVGTYVIYDDVNYIKGGWVNRNNFLFNGQKKLYTVILDGASPNKLINEILIKDDFTKFLKSIELNYKKAPYYNQVRELLLDIFNTDDKTLSNFLGRSLICIANYLSFDTKFVFSSELNKDIQLKGEEKVISICKELRASEYINAVGGQELYSIDNFRVKGIDLKFLSTNNMEYKQFQNEFVPWLSILDVLMFNSPEETNLLLDKFELI